MVTWRPMLILKTKSPVRDVCSQDVCLPEVIVERVFLVLLNTSSIGTSGVLICRSNDSVYEPLRPTPSAAVSPGDVANAIKVPFGVKMGANPLVLASRFHART